MRFIPSWRTPGEPDGPSRWFLFSGHGLLIEISADRSDIPFVKDPSSVGLRPIRIQYLGSLDGIACFCGDLGENPETPEGMGFSGLRRLYGVLDENLFWIAGRASQVVDFDRTHQYCGRCGSPTIDKADERAKLCPRCGWTSFPRMSPAIIVAVRRDGEILLARASRFPEALYSVLAGFVEPGESLEECVRREVREEVGIEVKDIRYFGSQPWPFPNSLMVGFNAEYESGEIRIDGKEIAAAGWFCSSSLPQIPDSISIARRLIDAFVRESHAHHSCHPIDP